MDIKMSKISTELAESGDIRRYVSVEIVPGSSEKCLLDTGASGDGISPSLLSECGLSDKVDSNKPGICTLADGTTRKVSGEINIPVTIGSKTHEVQFKVVENLQPRVCLGTTFMNKTGILADFDAAIEARLGTKPKN